MNSAQNTKMNASGMRDGLSGDMLVLSQHNLVMFVSCNFCFQETHSPRVTSVCSTDASTRVSYFFG